MRHAYRMQGFWRGFGRWSVVHYEDGDEHGWMTHHFFWVAAWLETKIYERWGRSFFGERIYAHAEIRT